jgi:hypothetical protein
MDEFKLKDYTERLKKETNENAHKMLYAWIKHEMINLDEYQQLVLNLSLQIVSNQRELLIDFNEKEYGDEWSMVEDQIVFAIDDYLKVD